MGSPWEEDILKKDFRVLTALGCDAFRKVMLACHLPTDAHVAVKILMKHDNARAHIISEAHILQSLEQSNTVHFFHFIDTLTMTMLSWTGKSKHCDFDMATQLAEGKKLENVCGSVLYWGRHILTRKPYD
ncbi:hypothetical protein A6R68_17990 [Neotoma lepida]|uniref:non-specific serine/threonine protein kinase n=1 Tax=Neotoma lepida TaxID=56216 RepID=A0A1A6HB84_NEOLE|nr:hypothetical protein A6R68_17990 [Neotoma lepida]